MDWSITHLWLILALLLGLAELTSGVMVLLALAIAAAFTAILALLGFSLEWQLVGMGLFSGILVPVVVRWLKPRFSPKGVAYGTTGTGVNQGKPFSSLRRGFDDATGIKVNGDFYRLRVQSGGQTELPEGTALIFDHFDGTTAIVEFATLKDL
jgi:membrane protein implicated in regulation of membrane protease activity